MTYTTMESFARAVPALGYKVWWGGPQTLHVQGFGVTWTLTTGRPSWYAVLDGQERPLDHLYTFLLNRSLTP